MEIDPVVFLAEELRCKERALRDAVKRSTCCWRR